MILNHWVKQPGDLPIKAGEIQVWVARLDEQKTSDFWELLEDEEKMRALRIKNPVGSRHFVVARGILRCLLGAYLDLDPVQLVFQYGLQGKPALSGCLKKTLSFNLSHSENLAVYGFAEGLQVGVDIEQIRPLDDLDAMANMTFSSAECFELKARTGAEKLDLFYMLWTCKEAVLKMMGSGLTQPMKSVKISSYHSLLEPIEAILPDGRCCKVTPMVPATGYTGAIAVTSD